MANNRNSRKSVDNNFWGNYSLYDDGTADYSQGWFAGNGKSPGFPKFQAYLDQQLSDNALWNSLSSGEKRAVLESAGVQGQSILGNQIYNINLNDIVDDFNRANEALSAQDYSNLEMPNFDQISQELLKEHYQPIYDRIAQEQADMREWYNNRLQMSNDMYSRNADMIMGNQMRQNAMIQDALRSDISRTRQNALEAGASAGLRIAGNINATLSAQNKAAQTSLDTSNNLAQMLLNQRQAAAGLRSDYQNYMSNSNRYRDSVQNDYMNRRSSEYGLQSDVYKDKVANLEDRVRQNAGDGYASPYTDRAVQNNIYKNNQRSY